MSPEVEDVNLVLYAVHHKWSKVVYPYTFPQSTEPEHFSMLFYSLYLKIEAYAVNASMDSLKAAEDHLQYTQTTAAACRAAAEAAAADC